VCRDSLLYELETPIVVKLLEEVSQKNALAFLNMRFYPDCYHWRINTINVVPKFVTYVSFASAFRHMAILYLPLCRSQILRRSMARAKILTFQMREVVTNSIFHSCASLYLYFYVLLDIASHATQDPSGPTAKKQHKIMHGYHSWVSFIGISHRHN
jgi:hypothetical protein